MATAVDPRTIEQSLADLDFPASKDDIVRHVEEHGAPEALHWVRSLPIAEYANLDEVKRSFPLADD